MKYQAIGTSDIVEAVQWDGNAHTANMFIGDSYGVDWAYIAQGHTNIKIPNQHNTVSLAEEGDWLVKFGDGRIRVWTNGTFPITFSAV